MRQKKQRKKKQNIYINQTKDTWAKRKLVIWNVICKIVHQNKQKNSISLSAFSKIFKLELKVSDIYLI